MKKLRAVNQLVGEKIGYKSSVLEGFDFQNYHQNFEAVVEFQSKLVDGLHKILQTQQFMVSLQKIASIASTKEKEPISQYHELNLAESMKKFETCYYADVYNLSKKIRLIFEDMTESRKSLEQKLKMEIFDPIDEIRKNKIETIRKNIKRLEGLRRECDSIPKKEESLEASKNQVNNYKEEEKKCLQEIKDFFDFSQKQQRIFVQRICEIFVDFNNRNAKIFSSGMEDAESQKFDKSSNSESILARRPSQAEIETIAFEKISKRAIVVSDFNESEEFDLHVKQGQEVIIERVINDDWYIASFDGKTGMVPSKFIQIL